MLSSLVDPLPSRALGVSRALIGSAAAFRALVAVPTLLRLADPGVVTAPVVVWMPEPTTALAIALATAWFVSALLFAMGWKVPLTGTFLTGSLVFALLLDHQNYGNHVYLMSWLVVLLVVADAGAGFSISRASRPVVRWAVLLLPIQTSLVYMFSGLTKFNESFASGEVLAGVLGSGLVVLPESWLTPQILGPVSTAALGVELFLAFGLWMSGLRRIAMVVGVGFHLTIAVLLAPPPELLVFGVLMIAVYPLYRLATATAPTEASASG